MLLKQSYTTHLQIFKKTCFGFVNKPSSHLVLNQYHPVKLIFAYRIEISFLSIHHKIL